MRPSRDESIAIAVFVKTPGLSPIKTRLAATVGQETAIQFYELSLNAVKSVVMGMAKGEIERPYAFTPYWAIAEDAGLQSSRWSEFQKVSQGMGGLGERLSCVYNTLIPKHSGVILIGADSPQMRSSLFEDTVRKLQGSEQSSSCFVLGPSRDGGFYLFGGAREIPEEHWTAITYSSANTASELLMSFEQLGAFSNLEELVDVDTLEDLVHLKSALLGLSTPTDEQKTLTHWLIDLQRSKS